ncbi:MAG: nickel-dependent hydrogenase large subunit [Candidatus Thermoplasmatota archaeon]|nr:nickel-dependent hydrogenase large subunit [Candidatus Thermoplasmatota archaeon]MCG2825350.1 nickel-dependent hydrogenase large subunit [Thermoplasmatales archaeon]
MKYTLPIGPIHPALKEPILFEFEMNGEKIANVDIKAGHNHRGMEWAGMRRNPVQIIYLAERICGICSASHPFTFCMAVENAANIPVPDRAEYLRVVVAELERIHSHILWAGIAAHELGFDSVLYLTWRVREKVMDILEYLTGNRVNYAMYMIGGIRRDITDKQIPKVKEALNYYKNLLGKLENIFLKDKTIKMRTRNVGVLTKEDALKLCAVGPTARASGVPKDVRQDYAYSAYADLDVKAITPDMLTGKVIGDVYDRIIVRLLEIKQSIDIIEECLKNMPSGEIMSEPKIPKLLINLKKAVGEGIGRHEAPRGEVVHYVKLDGKETPYTWKAKAPTYNNLLAWIPMLVGEQIADIPIVAASTDPCISCTDRVAVIRKNKKDILTKEMLHEMCVEKTRRLTR